MPPKVKGEAALSVSAIGTRLPYPPILLWPSNKGFLRAERGLSGRTRRTNRRRLR